MAEKEYIEREVANIAIQKKMQEYINKSVQPLYFGKCREDDLFTNAALGCRAALEEVKVIPAADVREVKRGKWIADRDDDYYGWNMWACSACGEEFVLTEGTPDMNDYHFCPNCGAMMEES